MSDNLSSLLKAITQIRIHLGHTDTNTTVVEQVINAGFVRRLVHFLGWHNVPQLQYEAAWVLTNISSETSEQTRVVIDAGAVPLLDFLVRSSKIIEVREQAIWALGNIAGDSPEFRDVVLRHGALEPILGQLNENTIMSTVRGVSWVRANFSKGYPSASLEQTKPAIPGLHKLISLNDDAILSEVCSVLSNLTEGDLHRVQALIDSGVCPRLVGLLEHPFASVLTPVIQTVGHIVSGDVRQTQIMIDTLVLHDCSFSLQETIRMALKGERAG